MTTGSRLKGSRELWAALAAAGVLSVGLAAALPPGPEPARAEEAEETTAPESDGVTFLDPLTDEPLELTPRPDEEITPAVDAFHRTGENPYRGDPEAIAAGQELYARWCQACHLEDATGRIGPNLVDETYRYPRADTDQGLFEIIHAGAAGAMQAFGDRLDQDEILQIIAFIHSLREEQG